jgi:hypothetical protein
MGDGTVEPDVFHDVFSCQRGDQTRTYSMRVVPGGAELWRMTDTPDGGITSIKEGDFKSSEEAAKFLTELRHALIAGGWQGA